MKDFVVDTNVIIAAILQPNSISSKLFTASGSSFYIPEKTIEEVFKYKNYIKRKAGLSEELFTLIFSYILSKVSIIQNSIISKSILLQANSITSGIDPKDALFVALHIFLKTDGIISYDQHFDKMGIKRYTPAEVLRQINFLKQQR